MILDHERLDVYRLALDFLVFAHQVIEALPRGRSHLFDDYEHDDEYAHDDDYEHAPAS